MASTFKSTDSLSSTKEDKAIHLQQKLLGLKTRLHWKTPLCPPSVELKGNPLPHHSSIPPGAPPARVYTSPSPPCWLQGILGRGDLLLPY